MNPNLVSLNNWLRMIFVSFSKDKQDCSYHGEGLNVPTAFEGLWSSSNNIKTLNEIK